MYTPNCDVFWPGSYPFKDPETAARRILKNPVLLLHWPQLPRRSTKERFLEQTYRALFGGRRKGGSKTAENDIEKPTKSDGPDQNSPSAFTKGTAAGWSTTWRLLARRRNDEGSYFKTQIAGPVTLTARLAGRVLQSQSKNKQRLVRYMSLWLDHAYWQIDTIKHAGYKPIIVLDEPMLPNYLGAPGSPQARKVLKLLRSAVKRLKARGALVGIHCCNRVSPTTLISIDPDMIHFDAYHFPTQLNGSREALQKYLIDGGLVAWGIVPTTEALTNVRRVKLEKTVTDLLAAMVSRGLSLKKVLAQSMIAPTCGTGSLTTRDSDEIMNFTCSLSRQIKSRYKL